MGRVVHIAVLAAIIMVAIAGLAPINVSAKDETVKVTVLGTYSFTNLTHYMYDDANKKLSNINTTYVEVLDYELRDKDSSDYYMPAVVLSLDAPSTDLNTNESIVYAWVLRSSYGEGLVVAVADINSTDNSVLNMSYYKVSPVSGDIAIVRTNYDINIQGEGFKLSIPLSGGFNDPKVLLMTDSYTSLSAINYIELRALSNPPDGYTLIRSGRGEAEFTISASGQLYVWFDEEHDTGDIDCFIFDNQNTYYSEASLSQTWGWLQGHNTASLWSDTGATSAGPIDVHGTVKFIIKRYGGDAAGVDWRVACRLGSATPNPQPPSTTNPSTTTTSPQPPVNTNTQVAELFGRVGSILGGISTSTVVAALIMLLIIVAIIAIVKR